MGQRLKALQRGHMLDAVIIVSSTEINDLKDRHNGAKLFDISIVVAALQSYSDEITLVLALAGESGAFPKVWGRPGGRRHRPR